MHQDLLEFDIRPQEAGDSFHLLNIDRKGSEIPFEVTDWQLVQRDFPAWQIKVATVRETPCAFVLYELDTMNGVASIHKLAALPFARTIGIPNFFVDIVRHLAVIKGFTHIETILPTYECRGKNDPYDVSAWLLSVGFVWKETLTEVFEAYGKVVDAYVFHKPVEYKDQR